MGNRWPQIITGIAVLLAAASIYWYAAESTSSERVSNSLFDSVDTTEAINNAHYKVELTTTDNQSYFLNVNGRPFFINGMNWDHFPIGTNYEYSLWEQPDDTIRSTLDQQMVMLQEIGVNAIRVYSGIPPKWIEYVYREYGIFTMVNHSFGRYGLTINGEWEAPTDYCNPEVRRTLLAQSISLVEKYENTPGLLLFLLGNENNYGLSWEGAETENIPGRDAKKTQLAHCLYQLFNDAAVAMKQVDGTTPIALCNGDLLYLDLIEEECRDIDVLGLNAYRGINFTDLFDRVKRELGKPVVLTEFGVDAFDARKKEENQLYQAEIIIENWKDIYENAATMGQNENCIGGFTFQFTDGWWKTGQTTGLEVHDSTASWANGGYTLDFVDGLNNMNEEWFGVCAKLPTDQAGNDKLVPRAAFFALKEIHQFNPFVSDTLALQDHFGNISSRDALLRAKQAIENSN